jgi:hypothetical protein
MHRLTNSLTTMGAVTLAFFNLTNLAQTRAS